MAELKIYKSRWQGIKLMLLCSLFVVPSIVFLLYHLNPEHTWMWWLCTCFFGLGYPLGLFQVFDRRPRVIINDIGIYDRTLESRIINWEVINTAYFIERQKQYYICLEIDPKFEPSATKSKFYKKMARINKELGFQELNIVVTNLDVDRDKLLNLILMAANADTGEERNRHLEQGIGK